MPENKIKFSLRPGKMRSYMAVPGIFDIETNVNYLPGFQFASHLLPLPIDPHPPHFKVRFQVVNRIENLPLPHFHVAGADPQADMVWLSYGNRFINFQFIAEGLKKDTLDARTSRFYIEWYRNRIEILYPPSVILNDLVNAMLLHREFSPVHSSCVAIDGQACLITAPAGTGKTTSALNLIYHREDAQILSDDIVITDGTDVWGCPLTASAEYDFKELGIRGLSRWKQFVIETFPLAYPFLVNSINPLVIQIPPNKIGYRARARYLFFLERGTPSFVELEPSVAARKLVVINRLEFSYIRNVLLSAYSFHDDDVNILRLMEREEQILRSLTSNVRSFLVREEVPFNFWKTISAIIEKK